MGKRLGGAVLAAVLSLSLVGCEYFIQREKLQKAKGRVEIILEGIKVAGNSTERIEAQTALCKWYDGSLVINDMGILDHALNKYDAWRRQGGIYPTLEGYTIDGGEYLPDEEPPGAVVWGSINGKDFEMWVPEQRSIEWDLAPGGG